MGSSPVTRASGTQLLNFSEVSVLSASYQSHRNTKISLIFFLVVKYSLLALKHSLQNPAILLVVKHSLLALKYSLQNRVFLLVVKYLTHHNFRSRYNSLPSFFAPSNFRAAIQFRVPLIFAQVYLTFLFILVFYVFGVIR